MAVKRWKASRRARPFDMRTIAEGMSSPGIDPRQWVSYGRVTAEDRENLVVFDETDGQPYVSVTLEPSRVPVFARVRMSVAGNGEGEWEPYVEGDEVICVIPEGNERAGVVIIGKLCNAIDKFPMESVAGQDPTTNTFAFSRRRTPKIDEYNGPIIFRSAKSDTLFGLDAGGTFTVKAVGNSVLQMSPDVIGFQGPSDASLGTTPKHVLQLDITGKHFLMQMEDAILSLSGTGASPEQNMIGVPGALAIGTSGQPPLEHALSTEAAANILFQAFTTLAAAFTALGAAPQTGTTIGTAIGAWLTAGFPGSFTTAAGSPLPPTVLAAIFAVFASPPPKPQALGGQTNPGIGCAGLLVG